MSAFSNKKNTSFAFYKEETDIFLWYPSNITESRFDEYVSESLILTSAYH